MIFKAEDFYSHQCPPLYGKDGQENPRIQSRLAEFVNLKIKEWSAKKEQEIALLRDNNQSMRKLLEEIKYSLDRIEEILK